MPEHLSAQERSLKILHVLRAPLGGLFRHVLDLSQEQIKRGHQVGLIADSSTGGAASDRILDELRPRLALGLTRFPMRRNPHPSDFAALARVVGVCRAVRPDVVHGHGSKGSAYARLPALLPGMAHHPIRVYTPHGGSLNYAPGTLLAAFYMGVEGFLARRSDLILFESAYIAERYRVSVGEPPCLTRVALNGIEEAEFDVIEPREDAADFLYVGELREAKGIDTLLDALASACHTTGRRLCAVLVGSGPDRALLEARAKRLGIEDQVTFAGRMPARQAFTLGRVLVVPSRAESLPYIVLEAAGAQVPMIATGVGGIPEIFGPFRDRLVAADDVDALRGRMLDQLAMEPVERQVEARQLADYVHSQFNIERMVDGVMAGYRDALAEKTGLRPGGRRVPLLHSHRYG